MSIESKLREHKGKLPVYPADHQVGMKVPEGGSDCEKCEYVKGNDCSNKNFVKWNGSEKIPGKITAYCCDFFEAKENN